MNNVPTVEITRIPRHSYYEWFVLGFYELERKGLIKFKLNVDWVRTVAKYASSRYINGPLKRIFRRWEEYNLEGKVTYRGKTLFFCVDCNDTPYAYDSSAFERVVCYFKMQCPISFNPEGFYLTKDVCLPWCDHRDEQGVISREGVRRVLSDFSTKTHKIRPLMVGPRMLTWGLSYRALKQSYDSYRKNCYNEPTKTLMAYFGNAHGPYPSTDVTQLNLNKEDDVVAYGGDRINHPNEKRKVAHDFLLTLDGRQYDSRVLSERVSGQENLPGKGPDHKELVIPRDRFCDYISQFQYNLNISGFTMSIPNRFIESFMVGTAIVTDKLALKWYKPFGCEVVETVPMGYMPMDEVDWEQFKKDIVNLPPVNKKDILHEFDTKWRPDVVAQYMIDEILAAGEA